MWLKFPYVDKGLIRGYNTFPFVTYIFYAKYGLRVHGWCAYIYYTNANNEKANLDDCYIVQAIP